MSFNETDAKPLFLRGPSLGTRVFLFAVASILLMILDQREHHLTTIRNTLSVAVYPIRALADLPFSAQEWLHETFAARARLQEQNARLRHRQLVIAAKLQRFAALEAENTRLRELMDSTAQVADRILVAEIMAVDLDPYRHRIALNKGTRDGVYQGQAILDAQGIVGQVTRAEPLSSEAVLISDPSHAMPVQVNRNGLRTIAVGTGDIARLALPFLPNNADIRPGDLLISSGLGGGFPAGYPVARVAQVDRAPGEPFAKVSAEPMAALNRDREVLLVWSRVETPEFVEAEDDGAGEPPAEPIGDPTAAPPAEEEPAVPEDEPE
ncbi:MAG: rod shape-determining protein MreC [Gammaproteobacteria bacterium]|nr:rod shape-determining protein MreC [Gammaproteobacteria bacterium]